jgi:hypothetical protein
MARIAPAVPNAIVIRTRSERTPAPADLTLPIRLTYALAVVASVASAVGVFRPGIFRDPAMTVGNAQGTALIILVVAIPTLIISMFVAVRGSLRAVIVWLGALGYILYNAVVYAFSLSFNALFLVYVAMLSLALWSFMTLLLRIDAGSVRACFAPTVPARILGCYLLVIALLNALAWLAQIVPAMLRNSAPANFSGTSFLTNPFHVLDLAFSLPLMALTAVWFWRRHAWGFVLAGMYFVMLTIEALSVATDQTFGHIHDRSSSLAGVPMFAALALIGLLPLAVYFHNFLRDPAPEEPRSGAAHGGVA